MLKIKRVYEKPENTDGVRVLVDRLWPRGLTKDAARIDKWIEDIAPSDTLRKWFAHKQQRWPEFKVRYTEELENKKDLLKELKDLCKAKTTTLLYAARDTERNNAQVLLGLLQRR